MYRECASHADQILCVADLLSAAKSLSERHGYSAPDARTVALVNIGTTAGSALMALHLLNHWSRGSDEIRQLIPRLVGVKMKDGVQATGEIFEHTSRMSLVLLAQFQIENLLRNIARELSVSAGLGFYGVAQDVLARLALPADCVDVLNTPARIRNSLHSNGIHRRLHPDEAERVVVQGVAYEFRDGQPLECASWAHVAHALEASVGVVGEILDTPDVAAIPDPMFEHFARTMSTEPGGAS